MITAEHLAALAARILAIMPRTGGKALDGAAVEIAMLIGTLCKTSESADELADQLVRHPWRRWNFAEFSAVAERMVAPPAPEFTAGTLKSHLVPDLFSDAEYEALYRRAVQAGLKFCNLEIPDVIQAHDATRAESRAAFDAIAPDDRERLMEECRAEYIGKIKRSWPDGRYDRTTVPPFLDPNAREIAESRIYRNLLLGTPIILQSEKPLDVAGPTKSLGEFSLGKLAQKKRL